MRRILSPSFVHANAFNTARDHFTALPAPTLADCRALQDAAGKLSYREQSVIDGALYAALRAGALPGVDYVKAKDALDRKVDERKAAFLKVDKRMTVAQLGGLVVTGAALYLGVDQIVGVAGLVGSVVIPTLAARFAHNSYGRDD